MGFEFSKVTEGILGEGEVGGLFWEKGRFWRFGGVGGVFEDGTGERFYNCNICFLIDF